MRLLCRAAPISTSQKIAVHQVWCSVARTRRLRLCWAVWFVYCADTLNICSVKHFPGRTGGSKNSLVWFLDFDTDALCKGSWLCVCWCAFGLLDNGQQRVIRRRWGVEGVGGEGEEQEDRQFIVKWEVSSSGMMTSSPLIWWMPPRAEAPATQLSINLTFPLDVDTLRLELPRHLPFLFNYLYFECIHLECAQSCKAVSCRSSYDFLCEFCVKLPPSRLCEGRLTSQKQIRTGRFSFRHNSIKL